LKVALMAWRFRGRLAAVVGGAVVFLSACGADSPPPAAQSASSAVIASVPNSSDPATISTAIVITTTLSASSSVAPTTSNATGTSAFVALVRESEATVADLYAKLGPKAKLASDEQLLKLRPTVCAPGYIAPDDNKIGVSVALFLRGTAQQDPTTGNQRVDGSDGTFTVNINWSDEVLHRLVDAQSRTYRALVSDHDRYCKDPSA
jgi:hypothetical protein